MMRRRELIALLVGAATTWPLVARAQKQARVMRVGILSGVDATDPAALTWRSTFERALQEFGWTISRNIRIEYRYTGGNVERMRTGAAELVRIPADLLKRRDFIALVGGLAAACPLAAWAQQPAMPAGTLAAQVRLQGHHCDEPLSATRDTALSKPNEAVWVLKCANATYRLRLIPNMAAKVEPLE